MIRAIHYKFVDIGVGAGGIHCPCCSPGIKKLKRTINIVWRNTEYKQIQEGLEDIDTEPAPNNKPRVTGGEMSNYTFTLGSLWPS